MSIDENNNRDKFNLFPINHLPDIHENNNRKQLALPGGFQDYSQFDWLGFFWNK